MATIHINASSQLGLDLVLEPVRLCGLEPNKIYPKHHHCRSGRIISTFILFYIDEKTANRAVQYLPGCRVETRR